MKKKILIGLLGVILMGVVVATYYFSSLSFVVDVNPEPIEVTYHIGKAEENCADTYISDPAKYQPLESNLDLGNLYPYDERRICLRIENTAEDTFNMTADFGGNFWENIEEQTENIPYEIKTMQEYFGNVDFIVGQEGSFDGSISFKRV